MVKKINVVVQSKGFRSRWVSLFFFLLGIQYVSIAQTPGPTYWWNDAVFYEVFVRSFKDSDGDGKGDLKGLINKLDYLNDGNPYTHNDLGVTALWLMPIQQSPSYHGYDVIDYKTVEQDYGTNQDFKDLIEAAHNRGIKVIIDFVMNHTSSQHPWFQSSKDPGSDKRNWYVWQNTNPGFIGPWSQTVWHANSSNYYYGIFWSEMPDLNYNTPEVKTEMFDAARFWLEDMNADGFRLDAVRYILENGSNIQDLPETIDFLKDFKDYYKSIKPNAFAVGEAWASTDIVDDYMADTSLDYYFEFDLASAIVTTASTGYNTALKTQVNKAMTAYPYLQFGTFLTNHDMNRVMTQLAQNTSQAKLAADLLLTLPGIPYVYYGEEIGMTGSGADENKRTPLQWDGSSQSGFTTGTPWRAVNSDYSAKNIASQQLDANSLWHRYRKLISIRNSQPALHKGNYRALTTSTSSVYSFHRQYSNENILVVSNTSSSTVTDAQLTLDQGITPGTYTLVELMGGSPLTLTVDGTGGFTNFNISSIPARSTLIYKLMDASEVATTVTFQVDMNEMITNGDFIVATESVDMVASFNNYGATLTTLTDTDVDGIYTVTVNTTIGSKLEYKYRINGTNNGREEFASSSYLREHLVLIDEDTVTDTYRKNITTAIQKPVVRTMDVYPVPCSKELFIEFENGFDGPINYLITDIVGAQKVSSVLSGGSHRSVSCESLSSGIYQLTLEYNGVSEIFRIVVQK